MNATRTNRPAAFRPRFLGTTLTELLAVIVILMLLAALAVPVASRRMHQARVSKARSDMEELAQAEDMVAATHGFYVPLQVLDDLSVDPRSSGTDRDDLENDFGANLRLIDAHQSPEDQVTQFQLRDNSPSPRVRALVNNWAGPFANFHHFFTGVQSSQNIPQQQQSSNEIRQDHPLDPWSNPYRLYSPIGITGSTVGTSGSAPSVNAMAADSFSSGNLTNTDDRFDRYAIVSFGPDGVSDNTQIDGATPNLPTTGDDIIYYFGSTYRRTETIFGTAIPTVPPTP